MPEKKKGAFVQLLPLYIVHTTGPGHNSVFWVKPPPPEDQLVHESIAAWFEMVPSAAMVAAVVSVQYDPDCIRFGF